MYVSIGKTGSVRAYANLRHVCLRICVPPIVIVTPDCSNSIFFLFPFAVANDDRGNIRAQGPMMVRALQIIGQ